MCTQKVPYCYMPINIFVIALLKNMNLVCPVIGKFPILGYPLLDGRQQAPV